jgi:hypothetical protein
MHFHPYYLFDPPFVHLIEVRNLYYWPIIPNMHAGNQHLNTSVQQGVGSLGVNFHQVEMNFSSFIISSLPLSSGVKTLYLTCS